MIRTWVLAFAIDVALPTIGYPEEWERDNDHHLIIAAQSMAIDRGTTGTPAGYGYDSDVASGAGIDVRALVPAGCSECMTHGLALGYTYSAGPTFGTLTDAAFRIHLVDAGYALRWELPCMRRRNRHVSLTGLLGVAWMYARPGSGDVAYGDAESMSARLPSVATLEHVALGWRLGASFDATFGGFLMGVGLDIRELYGIDTQASRTFMVSFVGRVGFDISWSRRHYPDPRESPNWALKQSR